MKSSCRYIDNRLYFVFVYCSGTVVELAGSYKLLLIVELQLLKHNLLLFLQNDIFVNG